MQNRKIKKIAKEVIQNYKGQFKKNDLREEVSRVLKKKGFVDSKTNNSCFEEVYGELKSQNKFFYLERDKKEKLFIH